MPSADEFGADLDSFTINFNQLIDLLKGKFPRSLIVVIFSNHLLLMHACSLETPEQISLADS